MADNLADSVIERMKKPKEEQIPIENGKFIQVNRAEMFSLTCRELAAVIQKNPDHPCAEAYKKAVRQSPPDEPLLIEKIDLEALLDNKEVVITETEGETEVEGIKMAARFQEKKLGKVIEKEGLRGRRAASVDITNPNQPDAPATIPAHKGQLIGGGNTPQPPFRAGPNVGASPARPAPNEGSVTPGKEPRKPFADMGDR